MAAEPFCASCFFCWVLCTVCETRENIQSIQQDLHQFVRDSRPPIARAMEEVVVCQDSELVRGDFHENMLKDLEERSKISRTRKYVPLELESVENSF